MENLDKYAPLLKTLHARLVEEKTATPFLKNDIRIRRNSMLGETYANKETKTFDIWIKPEVPSQERVLFHELGHIVMGHFVMSPDLDETKDEWQTFTEFEAETFAHNLAKELGKDVDKFKHLNDNYLSDPVSYWESFDETTKSGENDPSGRQIIKLVQERSTMVAKEIRKGA